MGPSLTRDVIVTTPTKSRGVGSVFAEMRRLQSVVERGTACDLPGCLIKYDTFMPVMWRAVQRGFVLHEHAVCVANGLRFGFDFGLDASMVKGQRVFRNYKTAVDAMDQVGRAVQSRVDAGKTVCLGDFWQRSCCVVC